MPIYHNKFSSDCAYLDVNCLLKYFDGTSWINADLYSGVVDGKFSDGQFCYTVSNGVITSKYSPAASLYVQFNSTNGFVASYYPSNAIVQTTTIDQTSLYIIGYTDQFCSVNSGETTVGLLDLILYERFTIGTQDGSPGFTSVTNYYKFNGPLTINGTSRNDGDSFYIGETLVDLSFPSICNQYF